MTDTAIDPLLRGVRSLRESRTVRAVGLGAGVTTVALGVANNRRAFQDISKIIPRNLKFPSDLDSYNLSMSFDIMEYKRRSIFKQPYIKPKGTIRLPVAKNIADKFRAEYSEKGQSPLVGAVVEQLLGSDNFNSGIVSNLGSFASTIASAGQGFLQGLGIEELRTTFPAIGEALRTKLDLEDVIQPLGLAVNPFLTVMFDKPTFKTHAFTWKFIPRNPAEAREINKIITLFKFALLPDIARETSGTLLNYPNTIQVGFFGGDNYLYRFKPCVITDFSANYAPANTPSFFKGSQNVPTEIDISMTLKEIEYWTKLDFEPYKDPENKNELPNTGGFSPNNP